MEAHKFQAFLSPMGQYLAKPVTRKEREDGVGDDGLRYAAVSMQGWRLSQEDSHIALPFFGRDFGRRLALFAVFDGHCGGVVSSIAANLLPQKLSRSAAFKAADYPLALREAFLALEKHLDSSVGRRTVLLEAAKIRRELADCLVVEGVEEGVALVEALDELCCDNPDGMGCTAVVALLEYGEETTSAAARLHVANCGDSRCVLWDARGKIFSMSKDHKPWNKQEKARVEAAGGWVSSEGRIEGNLNLSRALADFDYKRTRKTLSPEVQMISGVPDVRSRELRRGDRYLLLGCDGVWETRRGSQATVDVLRGMISSRKLSTAVSGLLTRTLGDGTTSLGMDNMTAVLVQLPVALPASVLKRPAKLSLPTQVLRRPAKLSAKPGGVRRTVQKRQALSGTEKRITR